MENTENTENTAPEVDYGKIFEPFGGLPEELNTDNIYDTFINSELVQARLNERNEQNKQSYQDEFFAGLRDKFGIEDDVKDLDTLQARLNNQFLEKYSGKDKELRQSLDEVSKRDSEAQKQLKDWENKASEWETQKAAEIESLKTQMRKEAKINSTFLSIENVIPNVKLKPELYASDFQNFLKSKGIEISENMELFHDGTKGKNAKSERVFNDKNERVSLEMMVTQYLTDFQLIQTQSVSGQGTPERKKAQSPKNDTGLNNSQLAFYGNLLGTN